MLEEELEKERERQATLGVAREELEVQRQEIEEEKRKLEVDRIKIEREKEAIRAWLLESSRRLGSAFNEMET
jgi:hypothetical protein